MRRTPWRIPAVLILAMLGNGCGQPSQHSNGTSQSALIGAWRAKLQFETGPFSSIKDLEFMYVFNAGGTMTESSNYDAAPPVPPAYGVWRQTGDRRFEARYEFYMTRVPDSSESLAAGNVWLPTGRGVLSESITLSEDGKSFSSRIHYDGYDQSGKLLPGGGDAGGEGTRIEF